MMAPRKCSGCRERAVRPEVLDVYRAEIEHDGRKYTVEVPCLAVLKCQACGELVLDDDADERVIDALREAAGLLKPAEIRLHRKELKLTQEQLAGLLSIAESTLSRWETGTQIQQRSMDRMLRAFFEVPELRKFFGAPEHTWRGEAEIVYQDEFQLTRSEHMGFWSAAKQPVVHCLPERTVKVSATGQEGMAA
ncbi:type II TA system antitoxin MqsA family protein [Tautonia rosea]|uniref:type II TA system antitoxin MqsA family protein n=1 Tax=Tautonia rosea TaxID=2728037 RepID=UPI00147609DD|nr:type II TA system antitoxin MqsA family protein [Tautonia rosea]